MPIVYTNGCTGSVCLWDCLLMGEVHRLYIAWAGRWQVCLWNWVLMSRGGSALPRVCWLHWPNLVVDLTSTWYTIILRNSLGMSRRCFAMCGCCFLKREQAFEKPIVRQKRQLSTHPNAITTASRHTPSWPGVCEGDLQIICDGSN